MTVPPVRTRSLFRPMATAALLALSAGLVELRGTDPSPEGAAAAREAALDVAGAFANDGFKLRDGFWSGRLDPKESRALLVNLFAGNHYWFSAAFAGNGTPVLELYDEQGRRLETEPWNDGQRAAAGYSPTASGPYYLRIRGPEEGSVDFCLVYSYK